MGRRTAMLLLVTLALSGCDGDDDECLVPDEPNYEGTYTIRGPGDLEEARDQWCIAGSLTISSAGVTAVDLPQLERLDGSLYILGNADLVSVDINRLSQFGGGIEIRNNPQLSRVGLASVRSANVFHLERNDALADLSGFSNLSVTYSLTVEFSNLSSLEGLEGTTALSEYLSIMGSGLPSLAGLDNLTTVGRFVHLGPEDELTSLSGLDSLVTVGEYFSLSGAPLLTDLDGLGSLETVGDACGIGGNHGLTSLAGLDSLRLVAGPMSINSNSLLPYCEICPVIEQLDPGVEYFVEENLEDACWVSEALACP